MSVNTGDTAWLLISTALVLLMTPALALFYGGMVRRKNVLSTMMMSFAILALVSILWVIYGYSLSFGPDKGGIIGALDWIGLTGVGQDPSSVYATTVPHLAFMIFQAAFAIITVALWTGAVVERIKFSVLLVFSTLWLTLVYCPIAHWVWGSGGWLAKLGALDFAGGTVVHVNAGISALALATGIFATAAVNSAGSGLIDGNGKQVLIQLAAIAVTIAFAFSITWFLAKLVDVTMGLRVTPEEETVGLDISQHGERAYGGLLR